MPNKLIEQLEKVLPEEMHIPEAIKLLYQWIEDNKFYTDNEEGHRIGFLFPDELNEKWTETERYGGTNIGFAAAGTENLHYWFGNDHEETKERLCVFAQTGAEGSEAALWLAPDGKIKIVHMGSGSGSVLTCVLAHDPVDFLRLLAIGYDEICWNEEFDSPPNENDEEFTVYPNEPFQEWVKTTFKTDIPKTASEIVKYPAEMGDEQSKDEFFTWCIPFTE